MTIPRRPSVLSAVLAALVGVLSAAPVRAEPIAIVTLGDSLTDTYQGKPYGVGNQSWTDLLVARRAAVVNLTDLARAGSTSGTLLAQGQHTTAAQLIRHGDARYATVMIGANDVGAFLAGINPHNPATFDPTPYVRALAANLRVTVDTLHAAGAAGIVLTNVPDIGRTPNLQAALSGAPVILHLLTVTTDAVNAEIAALAAAKHLPLVDLHALSALAGGPVLLGGLDVQGRLYAIDGFHPSTIGSGLLANAELEALRRAYHVSVPLLSDAEILNAAGLSARNPSATFDVSSYVFVHSVPEPSSLCLIGLGTTCLFGYFRLRRRTRSAAASGAT
jgi:lysophospholipase L1-like esterase